MSKRPKTATMEKDYGEPLKYDPQFSGPVHSRSCTDVLWLIIFLIFLGGWGFVSYYSIRNGNVERLLAPMDTLGRRCGLDSDVSHKPYLVFFDITRCLSPDVPITGCPTPQVCVETCPDRTIWFANELNAATWEFLRPRMVCQQNVNPTTPQQALQYIQNEQCAKYVVKSEPALYRCIGDLSALSCKDGPLGPGRAGEVCVSDPSQKQTSLRNRATALDTYIGMIVASWVTFFTRNDRDYQILLCHCCLTLGRGALAVIGRCFINVTEAVDVIQNNVNDWNMSDDDLLRAFSRLIRLNELSSQIVEDLVQARWYLLGALFAVVILCLIYIVVLRWVVGPVVWASIVGLIALLCFATYLCYRNYAYYRDNPVGLHPTTNARAVAESIFMKKETWLVLLIITAVVVVLLALVVIFLRKRITIAIALIREGSKAVGDIKSTVAFPIFPWALECCVIALGVVVLMYLLSIGEPSFGVVNMANDTSCSCHGVYTDSQKCDPDRFASSCHDAGTSLPCRLASCHFRGVESPSYIVYMHIVNVIGFFWAIFFIQGVSDMMLASTFSTWYWTFEKRDLPFFTLTSGIYRAFRFHLGTVAFGALIITIVRIIRLILEYIDQKLKKFDNPFTRCLMCFCKCCFLCLENFLKFINKNAYIMCAIHGNSFCKSARDAFSLLMRNIVRVVVLDKVTDFIFFLSKLLISIGVGIAVYYLLQWTYVYEVTGGDQLHYNYVPAIILSIVTYLITTIFFNVYSMAVDTLFLCFLEDCERNDGSAEKPYFMSRNLMKILGKRNKID